MDIPKPMIKCCRLIVLICVSVVFFFINAYAYFVLVSTPFPLLVLTMMLLSLLIFVILVCWDATITTSIWLVNRKTFVNDTLSSRGTENYYLENAELFCRKLLGCSLAVRKSLSLFLSMSHLVSENKSIDFHRIFIINFHSTVLKGCFALTF